MAAARLRVREFGRVVLQSAPTGYSAVVLPDGRVVAQTELGAPGLLCEIVPRYSGLTPYARLGDLPFLALAFLTLLAPARAVGRRSAPLQVDQRFHPPPSHKGATQGR